MNVKNILRLIELVLVTFLLLTLGDTTSALSAQIVNPESQQPQWHNYTNSEWGFSINYPSEWELSTVFTNDNSRSLEVIRLRNNFLGPLDAEVTIDVWQKSPDLGLMEWITEYQLALFTLGGVKSPQGSNALINGHNALTVSQPGSCMYPQLFEAFIETSDRIFLVQYTASDDGQAIPIYREMLASLSVDLDADLTSAEDVIPEFTTINAPAACEYAPNQDGCCGYPQVPHWVCSRDTATHQHKGNCVYWAAYKRPDVGLAVGSGNAGQWAVKAQQAGCSVSGTPHVGDIMVIESDPGHVAYVTKVNATTVNVTEMNWCTSCPENSNVYYINGRRFINDCDRIPPETTATVSGTTGEMSWYISNVQVALVSVDNSGGSGVKAIQYRVDSGTWTTYSDPVTISGEGIHTFGFKAQDKAENWEVEKIITIAIDTFSPTGMVIIGNGSAETYSTAVNLTSSANDSTSGVAWIRFRDPGQVWSDWYSPSSSIAWQLIGSQGQTLGLEAEFQDRAGNVSPIVSDTIVLNLYPTWPASSNYQIIRSAWGVSGTESQSSGHMLKGTVGQTAMIGIMENTNYELSSGYWGFYYMPFRYIYLPVITR